MTRWVLHVAVLAIAAGAVGCGGSEGGGGSSDVAELEDDGRNAGNGPDGGNDGKDGSPQGGDGSAGPSDRWGDRERPRIGPKEQDKNDFDKKRFKKKKNDGKKDHEKEDLRVDFEIRECAEREYAAKTCFEISGKDLKHGFVDFGYCPVDDFRVFVKPDGKRDFEYVEVMRDGEACREHGLAYQFDIPEPAKHEPHGSGYGPWNANHGNHGKHEDRKEHAIVCVEFYDYVPIGDEVWVGAKSGDKCVAERIDCERGPKRYDTKKNRCAQHERYDAYEDRCVPRDYDPNENDMCQRYDQG